MTRITLATLLLGFVAVARARAGTLAGVDLPDRVRVDGTGLVSRNLSPPTG